MPRARTRPKEPIEVPIPNDVEAEALLLWQIIVNPSRKECREALKLLHPTMFFDPFNSWVFGCFKSGLTIEAIATPENAYRFNLEIACPAIRDGSYWWWIPWYVERIKVASRKRRNILEKAEQLRLAIEEAK